MQTLVPYFKKYFIMDLIENSTSHESLRYLSLKAVIWGASLAILIVFILGLIGI